MFVDYILSQKLGEKIWNVFYTIFMLNEGMNSPDVLEADNEERSPEDKLVKFFKEGSVTYAKAVEDIITKSGYMQNKVPLDSRVMFIEETVESRVSLLEEFSTTISKLAADAEAPLQSIFKVDYGEHVSETDDDTLIGVINKYTFGKAVDQGTIYAMDSVRDFAALSRGRSQIELFLAKSAVELNNQGGDSNELDQLIAVTVPRAMAVLEVSERFGSQLSELESASERESASFV
jgi:hypothetical protein